MRAENKACTLFRSPRRFPSPTATGRSLALRLYIPRDELGSRPDPRNCPGHLPVMLLSALFCAQAPNVGIAGKGGRAPSEAARGKGSRAHRPRRLRADDTRPKQSVLSGDGCAPTHSQLPFARGSSTRTCCDQGDCRRRGARRRQPGRLAPHLARAPAAAKRAPAPTRTAGRVRRPPQRATSHPRRPEPARATTRAAGQTRGRRGARRAGAAG